MKNVKAENILISSACFRQRVTLSAKQVDNLNDEELSASLAFEVEPFSGIHHSECKIAWKRLSDKDSSSQIFDVIQIKTSDLIDEQRKARAKKKKYFAVTSQLDDSINERIEDLPYIEFPRSRFLSFNAPSLIALGAAILLAAISFDVFFTQTKISQLKREIAARSILRQRKTKLQNEISSARKEIESIIQRRSSEESADNKVAVLRNAWQVLLSSISEACGDESFITSITPGEKGFSAIISGTSLSPNTVAQTFVRLTKSLQKSQSLWSISLGDINTHSAGATTSFTCTVILNHTEAK